MSEKVKKIESLLSILKKETNPALSPVMDRLISEIQPFLVWRFGKFLDGEKIRHQIDSSLLISATTYKMVKKFKDFKGGPTLRFIAWVSRIAKNLLNDEIRNLTAQKRSMQKKEDFFYEDGNPIFTPVDKQPTAQDELIDKDMRDRILSEIPEDCKKVFNLYLSNYSRGYEEIATELGLKKSEVSFRITQSLKVARRVYERLNPNS